MLINIGETYPLDLARVFKVGRSLITSELTRLSDAGLITSDQSTTEGRRVQLKLTAAGSGVQRRVKRELSRLVFERLGGYTREEILLCARMMRDFRLGPAGGG
jgi:DNA-binding MarR family transcriptional regulator